MRYVIRPRATRADTAETLSDTPHLGAQTVIESEPVDTGVLDKDGNSIWRVMSPIGFVKMREWS